MRCTRGAQGHRAMTATQRPPGKPRQARAIRTRDSVLAAAARVIDRQGLAATRLEEIATEAEVTKGALYFHFPSKSEIATAIVEQHYEQCARLALETQNWDLDGVSTLERFINELAMSYQRNAVARAAIRLGNEHERIGAEIRGTVRGLPRLGAGTSRQCPRGWHAGFCCGSHYDGTDNRWLTVRDPGDVHPADRRSAT